MGISGLVLWWLLQDGAGQALVHAVRNANLWYLAIAAALAVLIQVIRAWRFAILTSGQSSPPSSTMIGIATRLILLNFVLPFKLGELGFPLMMKRAFNTPFAQSAGILILSRSLDFGVVAAILLFTAAYLLAPKITGWSNEILALIGLVILILPVLVIDWLPWFRKLTTRWPRVDHLVEQLSFGALMIRPLARRLFVFALTCSIWLTHALIAFMTASSIEAEITFLPLAMASAASNIAFALPVSGVAGLGPPQAAWASMLALSGVDWTPAITTALLCHGLLLVTISTWGALSFWRLAMKPKKQAVIEVGRP
ncbi:MAG: lysylphosphatidylglycerol synthase transmembrane domain-containing protein [Geminicoccaceae bacterium]